MDENIKRELQKVLDVLYRARAFHRDRDSMNASTHLAAEVRWAPLTSALMTACETLEKVVGR